MAATVLTLKTRAGFVPQDHNSILEKPVLSVSERRLASSASMEFVSYPNLTLPLMWCKQFQNAPTLYSCIEEFYTLYMESSVLCLNQGIFHYLVEYSCTGRGTTSVQFSIALFMISLFQKIFT